MKHVKRKKTTSNFQSPSPRLIYHLISLFPLLSRAISTHLFLDTHQSFAAVLAGTASFSPWEVLVPFPESPRKDFFSKVMAGQPTPPGHVPPSRNKALLRAY